MVSQELRRAKEAAEKAAFWLGVRNGAIVVAHEEGATVRAIAEAVGLSPSRVHQILHGR